MEINGKVTPINLEAEFFFIDDTIKIIHEILGTVVKYKYKITETDCGAWKTANKTGLIVISVEQLQSAKPYSGKIFLEKKGQALKLVTLLDTIEGKYKLDYNIFDFKEL